jgi:hypothetical protein
LLIQKLEDLLLQKRKIDPEVDAMENTFKLWILSWMQIGGVENDEEFYDSLTDLRCWLGGWCQQSGHLAANAIILDEFLTMRILPYKERWFFPLQKGKLTFDVKTTSPLEGMNRVLKYTTGNKVLPNMPLLKSLQVMDRQASCRNRERHVQCCHRDRGRSTSIRSHTVNNVTPVAESFIGQQASQANRYACRIPPVAEGHEILKVELKRRPEEIEFCVACESNDKLCPSHCLTSPITVFRRIRLLLFIPCGRYYQVICTCFFHGCYGMPCRHVHVLLRHVRPHHIYLKHHTKFQAYYKRVGFEAITEEFEARRNDYRLCVTAQEKHEMITMVEWQLNLSLNLDMSSG